MAKETLEVIRASDIDLKSIPSRRQRRQERLGPMPEVKVRGEALSEPVYWTGRQWAVTSYGLECRDGTYTIPKERLWENEGEHSWYVHMCVKEWVDHADFAQALCEARDKFRELFPSDKRTPSTKRPRKKE